MAAVCVEVVLDNTRDGSAWRFVAPVRVITAQTPEEVGPALAAIQRAIDGGCHAAGYFSYELGYVLEPCLRPHLPADRGVPLLRFGVFDQAPTRLDATAAAALWPRQRCHASPLRFEWDQEAYALRFARVMDAIRAGETYQVNLSMRARFTLTGNPRAWYGRLRGDAAVACGAFVDDGEGQLLSFSPELFFAQTADGQLTTRPMKGTAPRDPEALADRAAAETLRTSAKDRAENVMIVDLLRNDLGRVAVAGSVRSSRLFRVETYPTVHQMTSTVQGMVSPGIGIAEVVRALFPCGSVTGAPKIRAMQLIRRLEDSPRGIYCGSVGMFAPDGRAHFNVAIRTLTVSGGRGELGVGGAIVSDSEPQAEYAECRLKARWHETARRPLALLETLACVDGAWPRRARHLARMERSAADLGLPFDSRRARQSLDDAVLGWRGKACRVRLCLHEDGRMVVDAQAMPPRIEPMRFLVCEGGLDGSDPLRRYKTDWRDAHADALAWARQHGAHEAVLVNEYRQISEGTFTNVFVQRDGRLLTPPVASGALPGCLRAELLDAGTCVEAVLTVGDLHAADRVFLGNSLRGLIRAVPARVDGDAVVSIRPRVGGGAGSHGAGVRGWTPS